MNGESLSASEGPKQAGADPLGSPLIPAEEKPQVSATDAKIAANRQALYAKIRKETEQMQERMMERLQKGELARDEVKKNHGFSVREVKMLKSHFALVDEDKSGTIERAEFLKFQLDVLETHLSKEDVAGLFDELDADKGGSLNFDEFMHLSKVVVKHAHDEMEARRRLQLDGPEADVDQVGGQARLVVGVLVEVWLGRADEREEHRV